MKFELPLDKLLTIIEVLGEVRGLIHTSYSDVEVLHNITTLIAELSKLKPIYETYETIFVHQGVGGPGEGGLGGGPGTGSGPGEGGACEYIGSHHSV